MPERLGDCDCETEREAVEVGLGSADRVAVGEAVPLLEGDRDEPRDSVCEVDSALLGDPEPLGVGSPLGLDDAEDVTDPLGVTV